MKKVFLFLLGLSLIGTAAAQAFQWPAGYAAGANQGGTVNEVIFGEVTTLNAVTSSSATESAILGMSSGGPSIIYRDWIGSRSYQTDGMWNLLWAESIEEVTPHTEFVITVKQGWMWSDGTEVTVDDVMAGYTIIGDPEVESNDFSCTEVDGEPVVVEKLGDYQYSLNIPTPQVNGLANKTCPVIPAHVYMPVYEADGAAGVKAMYGVDADPSTIVSAGPYVITEFVQAERIVLEKNPVYGENVQAANGDPLPGPDKWIITFVEDKNAQLAKVVTGEADFFYPENLDMLRAITEAQNNGAVAGELLPNIGPDTLVDFITYNFNNTDPCKAEMFSNPTFRSAMSIIIDREALVDAALGGIGVPAKDWNSAAALPFGAPFLGDFEFNPEGAVSLLASAGYSAMGDDGVLYNPSTGCRVEFDLQFNSGNNRRAQEAQVISQIAEPYGVKINAREVATDIWANSIVGDLDYDETGMRTQDYDAQIWGLAGGDVDNPSFQNGLRINTNLNSWNKSAVDVEPWEILMDRLTVKMNETLDLDERVAVYNERAQIMRDYLPMTPLISPAFHLYHNMSNVWETDKLDANSIESPYRPGGFRTTLATQ